MTPSTANETQLFMVFEPVLLRQALAMCRSRDRARDLVQETLVRAWAHWTKRPHTVSGLRAWMATILRNAFFSECRRLAVRQRAATRLELAEFLYDERALAESRGHAEHLGEVASARVWQALAALPPSWRSLVRLVDLEGLTYQEAAAELGCPIGTVMSRLHRARSRMRAFLNTDGMAALPC